MGCHTWFYKKKKEISDEEAKNHVMLTLDREIQFLEGSLGELDTEDKTQLRFFRRVLKGLEKGTIGSRKTLSALYYRDGGDISEIYHEGHVYEEIGVSDLFRIGGYPEDVLGSPAETKEFIERNGIKKVNWEKLDRFWNEHPDGLIRFG